MENIKDKLIKKLQDKINQDQQIKEDESANGFPSPYNCSQCDSLVKFNFLLPGIRNSGKCPGCY